MWAVESRQDVIKEVLLLFVDEFSCWITFILNGTANSSGVAVRMQGSGDAFGQSRVVDLESLEDIVFRLGIAEVDRRGETAECQSGTTDHGQGDENAGSGNLLVDLVNTIWQTQIS